MVVIHIAGYPGTGKTTYLNQLQLPVVKIHLDDELKKHKKIFLSTRSENYRPYSKRNVGVFMRSLATYLTELTSDPDKVYVLEGTFSKNYYPVLDIDHKFYLTVTREVLYARIQERLDVWDEWTGGKLNKARYQKMLASAESHVRSLGYRFVRSSSLTKKLTQIVGARKN